MKIRVTALLLGLCLCLYILSGCSCSESPETTTNGVDWTNDETAQFTAPTDESDTDTQSVTDDTAAEDTDTEETLDTDYTVDTEDTDTVTGVSNTDTTQKATSPPDDKTKPPNTTAVVTKPPDEKPKPTTPPTIILPQAPGTAKHVSPCGNVTIDYSNAAKGYITIMYVGNSTRPQLHITLKDKVVYDYVPKNKLIGIPLSGGGGEYTVVFVEGIAGTNQGRPIVNEKFNFAVTNTQSAFLMSNHFVNYNASSAVVTKATELAAGKTEVEVVGAVYNWFITNVKYDTEKGKKAAAGQMSGYAPDLNELMRTKRGICFDYASGMTAMLRSRGIPTRLEFGYASGEYHAWISVWTKETGWVNDWIRFNGNVWVLMDPTWGADGGDASPKFRDFIKNTKNYQTTQFN
ncbi:MAG: hypothetical protein FWG45_01290 [Oscillospiraceae bacterium]|nr:hypothetical protein [Oscillospiraceae bacterium]